MVDRLNLFMVDRLNLFMVDRLKLRFQIWEKCQFRWGKKEARNSFKSLLIFHSLYILGMVGTPYTSFILDNFYLLMMIMSNKSLPSDYT